MKAYQTILVSDPDAQVVTITLNRPERRNALNLAMVQELLDVFTYLVNHAPRVVVLTGTGRAFCSGADLLSGMFDGADGEERADLVNEALLRSFNPMIEAFYAIPCPKITAVNGVAAGAGVSLALLGDIVVAATSASFLLPFAPRLALLPDLSATWTLPHLIGRARARGLALLGEPLDATTAAEWGLIWQTVTDERLTPTVAALASRLAVGPTHAFYLAGVELDKALGVSLSERLADEREGQRRLAAHTDFAEGLSAFAAKREPMFPSE